MLSLASIQTEPTVDPPRIVIYGPGGIGKTTFGASAFSPIFAMTEKGRGKLSYPYFPLIGSYYDGMEIFRVLSEEEHTFKTLVWDSLDWWEPHIWQKLCDEHKKQSIEDWGYQKGYEMALDYWHVFLQSLSYLQEEKGMAIVLTAHCEVKRFDSPEVEPYDRYQIKLQRKAAALVEEWADLILFANWEVNTAKTDVGFNKKVARGVGSGRRILYTEERPAFKAKNRYGLPPEIEFASPFNWEWFSGLLNGAQPGDRKQAA